MRSPVIAAATISVTLLAVAALVAACGDEGPEAAKPAPLASATTIDRDPYAITCAHVRDQLKWADVTRRATVALADREPVQGLTRLRTTQSLFYAMTEICDGRPAAYRPADAAVRGVADGRYRADLSAP
jgi:hypothetical protein